MYFKDFPEFLYDFEIAAKVGAGRQATAIANMAGGVITSITVTDGGAGYTTDSAVVSVSFPQIDPGVASLAHAIVSNGSISQIIVDEPGVGYSETPTVSINPPYGILRNQTKALLVRDITRNIRFRRDLLANITVYDEYDIIDGETPEIIAEKIYGNAEYHWIIMLTNERYDYRTDFPLAYNALEEFITAKYGSAADDIHHYVNENGYIVDSDASGAVSISNRQYEESMNESKRRIKIISPELIKTVLKNFRDQL